MLNSLRNQFIPMFIAIIITTAGSIPLFILNEQSRYFVYACSPVVQIGLAIMINTSTSLISDVIGKDADSSAFVYGFYSFMDKIANGVAIERALKLFEKDKTGLKVIMGGAANLLLDRCILANLSWQVPVFREAGEAQLSRW